MIRLDTPYVDPDRTLTQAGYEVLKGQERRIDALEAADAVEAANAPGSAPRYSCRAWVNFNGTGTVAIRAAGNVSSITDNGTGDYTVNFTTAMPDANYAVIRSVDFDSASGAGVVAVSEVLSATTAAVRVTAESSGGTRFDPVRFELAVFR